MKKSIILIDSNSLIHRSFHALPPFKTAKGELVNAVYGFFSIILNIYSRISPNYIAAAFDVSKKTFRHEKYEEYKAKRVKAPDELYAQFGRIKEILGLLKVPVFEMEGFEADDVLATIATDISKNHPDINIYIVTSDKDVLQLVHDNIFVLSPKKGGNDGTVYTKEEVKKKFGLTTDQMIDFKALTGDPSDNIPGVSGIGEKTATALLQKYGTLDNIYAHINELTGATKKKIETGKKDAYFSKDMVKLVCNIPLDFNLKDCAIHSENFHDIIPIFEQLEFRSLIVRTKKLFPETKENPTQISLF